MARRQNPIVGFGMPWLLQKVPSFGLLNSAFYTATFLWYRLHMRRLRLARHK